jgi:hypothetical protein
MKEKKATDPRVNSIRGFYSALFKRLYGFSPTISFPKTGAVIKRLLNDFTESQCELLICVHFNWRGMDGTDEFQYKSLADRAFPLEWLGLRANAYQAFIRNKLGINFDDDTAVKQAVADYIKDVK